MSCDQIGLFTGLLLGIRSETASGGGGDIVFEGDPTGIDLPGEVVTGEAVDVAVGWGGFADVNVTGVAPEECEVVTDVVDRAGV